MPHFIYCIYTLVVIRKYQPNRYTSLWFTAFMWGVVFTHNQVIYMHMLWFIYYSTKFLLHVLLFMCASCLNCSMGGESDCSSYKHNNIRAY